MVNTATSSTTRPEKAPLALHAVEAEEAFLGGILLDPGAIDANTFVKSDDFYIVRNAWVWEAILALNERNEQIDPVTVAAEIKRQEPGRLSEIGGAAYLTYLINHTPSSIYTETYGRIVERAAIRRRGLTAGIEIANLSRNESIDVEEFLDRAEEEILNVRERATRMSGNYLSGRNALAYYANVLSKRTEAEAPELLVLPWQAMSMHVAGIRPGKVILVSGFSGEGKTIVMEGMAEWWAMNGHKIIYITTELGADDMLDRQVCRQTGIPYEQVVGNRVKRDQILSELRKKAGAWIGNIDYFETNGASARTIYAQIKRAVNHGRKIVFVDYLGEAVGFDTKTRELKDAIDGFFRTLHTYAASTDATIVVASQQSDSDHGPRIYGSSVPNHKSALHLRLETQRAKESRIYSIDNRLIPVRDGSTSPMLKVVIEKNTFGPKGEPVLFRDGARFRLLDEDLFTWSEAYSSRQLDEAAEKSERVLKEPQPRPLDLGF